jgi:hypothetical protein|tara:strand:- start:97 stop:366 length:270 start_codon:yes stop_codon:yes gene_type:complete
MKKVISEILKIDNSVDLNEVIRAVKAQQKAIKAMEVAKKKAIFTAGQKVKINSRDKILKGVIEKVNRTKAIVLIGDSRYDVPLTIMEAA